MKIRFDLTMLYQCFQCCQRGFVLLHSIEGSGESNDLWIRYHLQNTNGIHCVIKTMLKIMFIEMA